MTDAQKTNIVNALEAKLIEKDVSQNKAATMIGGISSPYLTMMKQGKWESISDSMWRKVANWVGVDLNTKWHTRETENFKAISELCLDAKENSRFLAVVGYTGSGKTTTLEKMANAPETYYVLCDVNMGRKEFLERIADAMGLTVAGSVSKKTKTITDYLNSAEKPLLILDDAGKLSDSLIHIIQVIYDQTERRAGIIIGGTEYLINYVFKMAAKDKKGFREFKRRVAYWMRLKGKVTKTFVKVSAVEFGITEEPALAYLYQECGNYGDLRNACENYQRYVGKHGDKLEEASQREILAGLYFGTKDAA